MVVSRVGQVMVAPSHERFAWPPDEHNEQGRTLDTWPGELLVYRGLFAKPRTRRRINWRRLFVLAAIGLAWIVAAISIGVAVTTAGGCQQVGPRAKIDRQVTELETPSPVTLQIEDEEKKGVVSGVGPARYTRVENDLIQTMQSGTTPRDVFVRISPDGTKQVNVSSGTDIRAKGITYNPITGEVVIAEFGTVTSEPLRAGNEAYDRLVSWWQSLSADQREARIAEVKAIEEIAPDVRDMLLALLAGL